MSSYICCALTICRLSVVSNPLLEKSKTNSDAWRTVFLLLVAGLLLNAWVPFAFEIQKNDQNYSTSANQIHLIFHSSVISSCDIKKEWKKSYFILTNIYVVLIILIPLVIIFICNLIIVQKTYNAKINREQFGNIRLISRSNDKKTKRTKRIKRSASNPVIDPRMKRRNALQIIKFDFQVKPIYLSLNQTAKIQTKSNFRIKNMLMIISLSYSILNLPYLITWCVYYKRNYF